MSCACAISKLDKGTIVVLGGEEGAGLFIYDGRSHHSTSYIHTVKLIRYNDTQASWHVPCGQVYMPRPEGSLSWPFAYKEGP